MSIEKHIELEYRKRRIESLDKKNKFNTFFKTAKEGEINYVYYQLFDKKGQEEEFVVEKSCKLELSPHVITRKKEFVVDKLNLFDRLEWELFKDCCEFIKYVSHYFIDSQRLQGSIKEELWRNTIRG